MAPSVPSKTAAGRFFEDFRLGEAIRHATPRPRNSGDASLYSALTGARFAPQSAETFARAIGYPARALQQLLAFHVVFGKTVSDVSLNAVANLGYADCRFLKPVFPGDTLSTISQVIGLKENSNRQSGVVYVRSRGSNQHGETVIDYVRWVMVRKADVSSAAPEAHVPKLPEAVAVESLGEACPPIDRAGFDPELSGSLYRFEDYRAGERIDHVAGVTVEEAEHQTATRLYQNAAKVHFNQFSEGQGRFGRRLIYGGDVSSLARALRFNRLANAFYPAALHGGRPGASARTRIPPWSLISTSGSSRRAERIFMRLPCDAVLLLIDLQQAIGDPRFGPRNNEGAEEIVEALLAAWRAEDLPIIHIRHDSTAAASPYRPDAPGHAFLPQARPREGETIIGKSANSAFVATDLEAALDRLGATTLVVCGVLTNNSLEATVRHGGNLGYRVFVVADACWAVDKRDLSGRLWPAADVHALSLANLQGEYAEIVSGAMALQAAAMANMRRRRQR